MMILVIILSLLITAIIHEMGHCWGIYRYGYRPTALSIGFGKPIFTIRYHGIPCSICPLPFGASVEVPPHFDNQSWWKKLVVDIAGPLVNISIGFIGLIITIISLCVSRGFSLEQTSHALALFFKLLSNAGHTVISTFEPQTLLGIGMEKQVEGWAQIASSEFSWPASIMLFFFINLGIGLFNLIPFPPLDGYHIVENIIIGVTGKRIPKIIDTIGFIILILISIVTFMTLIGYPVLYTWIAVLFGFLLGMIKHYKQIKK